jgi:hypothetical protein
VVGEKSERSTANLRKSSSVNFSFTLSAIQIPPRPEVERLVVDDAA